MCTHFYVYSIQSLFPYSPFPGAPGGAGVAFSLHSQQIVGSSPGAALVPLNVPSVYPLLSYQRPWCVVPCLWDIAHKRSLAIFRKEQGSDPGGRFLLYHLINSIIKD